VFSFAIIALELFEGLYIAENPAQHALAAASPARLRPPFLQLSYAKLRRNGRLVALVERCWADAPQERPTFDEVLSELGQIRGMNEFEAPTPKGLEPAGEGSGSAQPGCACSVQ